MKKVALVLEMTDDEAEIAIQVLSETKIRFGGETLGKLIEMNMANMPPQDETRILTHAFMSEGMQYIGHKPRVWTSKPAA